MMVSVKNNNTATTKKKKRVGRKQINERRTTNVFTFNLVPLYVVRNKEEEIIDKPS